MFARLMVALIVGLLCVNSTDAGIYTTFDTPDETRRLSRDFLKVFHGVIGDLRTISDKKPDREGPIRKRYILIEAMGNKAAADLKSAEDLLNYSAVLIRRGKADEAIGFLNEVKEAHPDNFLLYSHLATAHFLGSADFRRSAPDVMEEALSKWPERWSEVDKEQKAFLEKQGWAEPIYDLNRKHETYLHRLMKLRARELAKKQTTMALDALFVDKDNKPVKFVNENGKFEVGRIADAEKAKLPSTAIEIVEQLLLWAPNDLRLYWLLGELLNTQAMERKDAMEKHQDISGAHQIFKEMVLALRNDAPDEMLDHYESINAYLAKNPAPVPKGVEDFLKDKEDTDTSVLSNRLWWRTLSVGFVTGLAVGFFALWQVQEFRRRRQARETSNV